MAFLIDPPGPYASKEELEQFLAEMKQLPQDDPIVQSAIKQTEKNLAAATARDAAKMARMNHPKRKPFVEKSERLGGSIQLSLASFAEEFLSSNTDKPLRMKLAAAIANWVFHFGMINPVHAEDLNVMGRFEVARRAVFGALGETFKTNATGVLIFLGASWEIGLAEFRSHILNLAAEDFARVGGATPNVRSDLPEEDSRYLDSVIALTLPQALIDWAARGDAGRRQFESAEAYLAGDVEQNRFTARRALEVFVIALDNAVWASLTAVPKKRSLYREYRVSDLRMLRAQELTQSFKDQISIGDR